MDILEKNEPEKQKVERILIVDDNHEIGHYIEDILIDEGYHTIVCRSGHQALEMLKKISVDVVLLDVVMPDVNGYVVAKKIKKSVKSKLFLPVILVTALDNISAKVTGLNYADDYITKPFSVEELLARIRSMLRIRTLQRDLLRSQGNYKCLYEYLPTLILTLDCNLKIIECNNLFSETVGISKVKILGKNMFDLITSNEKEKFNELIDDLNQTQITPKARVFEIKTAYKEKLYVELKAARFDTEEAHEVIVISMENITEKIELEKEKDLTRKQLYRSAKLAAIGNLASGVAHEVNNPLTAILGFSDSILERLKSNDYIQQSELMQYLEIINQETLRCRNTIDNLSRFARGGESVISEVSLCKSLESVLKLVLPRASRVGIKIKNTVISDILLHTDCNKFEQVLISVFSNCIDFCTQNTEVTISLEKLISNGIVKLKITDEGPGIHPDILPKIFDPFFTTKEVGRETGMGLAICHRMMEECNGRIDVFNDLATKGTCVVLELPVTQKST
ncbi:response regulator [Chitinispirillales bacterium ANBcel5]|uniref:ATP-binding response regulator n=1 Tax=Cellulosispirillum alkaliphilum TaxID=3039283 RepID=UPI002A5147F0|nr:response regulator [Chitinispirillales bacterium ANBcel5]